MTDKRPDESTTGRAKWLLRLEQIIDKHLKDFSLSNQQLAKELSISERQLFRKVNEHTGLSPQRYQRRYRLRKAMKFFKAGTYRTVKETACSVGYIKVSYFITQFEKEFGKKPLQILQEYGWR